MKSLILALGLSMALGVPAFAFQSPSPPSKKMLTNSPGCGFVKGKWLGTCNSGGGSVATAGWSSYPPGIPYH